MITKHGAMLERCLESVQDLVDEICLCVDKSSTEQERIGEIGNKFNARLSAFQWEDSFAKARNTSLEQATCDWVIVMDSDNVLDPEGIPTIKAFLKQDQYDVAAMQIIHKMKHGDSMNWGYRIFRRGGLHYEGRKHNQPVFDGESVNIAAKMYHYGFDLTPEEQREKDKRDERLLLLQIEEEPNNAFYHANLVRNYRCQSRWKDLLKAGKQGLDAVDKSGTEEAGYSYQAITTDMVYACLELGRIDQGMEYALLLVERFPKNLDMNLYTAHLYMKKQEWREAINYYLQFLELLPRYKEGISTTRLIIDTIDHAPQAYNNMGVAYGGLGKWTGALRSFDRANKLDPGKDYGHNYVMALEQENQRIRRKGHSLKILFVQRSACIRNIKMATALSQRHDVGLAYQNETSQRYGLDDGMYCETIKLPLTGDVGVLCTALADAGGGYDIIHVHNEPDTLTSIAMMVFGGEKPIFHDCHDLLSVRGEQGKSWQIRGFEHTAMKYADGLVFVSEEQARQAHEIHGLEPGKAMVLGNFTSAAHLPKEQKPKLSEGGEFHIVYEGGLRLQGHRDCRGFFGQIADRGIHIHIYPAFDVQEYRELAEGNDHIHYYDSLPPDQLYTELTQYDAGIIPLMVDDTTREAKSVSMPNKLYEYLCCGLPVIARDLPALSRFITEKECGFVFNTVDDIEEGIKSIKPMSPELIMENQKNYVMEANIGQLERYYWGLLNGGRNE
jgi:tetratricopeptide (TPR) repeat protein